MKKHLTFAKLNLGLGILFIIVGTFIFMYRFNGQFEISELYLSFTFMFLGVSLLLASYLYKKENPR
ncbi:hypothetical protein KO561_14550 [Radiobacillus kanasensis]|uniref:hypothetical protein n=1 Tax=Radiobacillus kanasensis TaxID=2844358 RepID=UPI001E5449ED|nr:hypothetical protein [Radiobacillus kanasensis]UFT98410.1 hypothetical protein KO561_14550 [Radiobacillus kanasensis]